MTLALLLLLLLTGSSEEMRIDSTRVESHRPDEEMTPLRPEPQKNLDNIVFVPADLKQ